MTAGVDVRRSADRFLTIDEGVMSRHSFSFGRHYDSANTHHGVLVAHNDELVDPGCGFERHAHHNLEIVTWVLDGVLTHQDSDGGSATVPAGGVQRLSSGRGIEHSERNDGDSPLRFVQLWFRADESDTSPSYQRLQVGADRLRGRATVVATGEAGYGGEPAVGLGVRGVAVLVARMTSGEELRLAAAPYRHLFIATGQMASDSGGRMDAGDAVRLSGGDAEPLLALENSEILIVEMTCGLAG